MTLPISIEEVPEQRAAVIDYRVPVEAISAAMGQVFGELMAVLARQGAVIAGTPFSSYPDEQPDAQGRWRVITGFPIREPIIDEGRVTNHLLPGGTVAVATHVGPYDTLADTYREMQGALPALGYLPAGPMREYYLTDPTDEPDPAQWRTAVHWPVAPAPAG